MDSEYTVIDNPEVSWKGTNLNLSSSIMMQFILEAESIEGLTVKVTDESGAILEEISSDAFV